MARFLLIVWPFQTHLDPFLCVACALRNRGHEVAFYTGAAGLEDVAGEGFPCFPFEAVDDRNVDKAVKNLVSGSWRPGNWRDLMLGSVPEQLRDLGKIIDEWRPDVLVSELAMWGPILIFRDTRPEPVAVLSHVATCLLPGPDNPLPGMNWILPRAARRLAPLLARILRRVSAGVPRLASRLRQEHGLPPLPGTVTEFTGELPLYLVPSTPAFDGHRRDLPPSVSYVGPCLWDKNPDKPAPAWVGAMRQGRPCVVVVEGTIYPEKAALLGTAARALADAPFDVVLVAGKGRELAKLALGKLGQNVRLESWTPLSDLLPIADAIIGYGDSETAMAALSRNVPMVLMPMILDQPETALRVSRAGAGIMLSRRKRSPANMLAAVNRVLTDAQFRDSAARLSRDFLDFSGGDRAALLLEGLAVSSNRTASRTGQRLS